MDDVDIEIRNSGATPAIDVRNTNPKIICDEAKKAEREAQNFFTEIKSIKSIPGVSGFVLAPNDPHPLPLWNGPALAKGEGNSFEDVQISGKLAIYIVGAIKYQDIFKPTQEPYLTTYCFRYWPNMDVEFQPCPFGNSID